MLLLKGLLLLLFECLEFIYNLITVTSMPQIIVDIIVLQNRISIDFLRANILKDLYLTFCLKYESYPGNCASKCVDYPNI